MALSPEHHKRIITDLQEKIKVLKKEKKPYWESKVRSLQRRIKGVPTQVSVEIVEELQKQIKTLEKEKPSDSQRRIKSLRERIQALRNAQPRSGKKLTDLVKRDEQEQEQKQKEFYEQREKKRLAKVRKDANKRVGKISLNRRGQTITPISKRTVAEKKEKPKEAKKAVTPEVPESRSGLAQFWKDIKDLPSNLAKDFLPKQIKGSKEEGYTQEREDMGPGKRKYKWGDLEFTLDTTEKEMTKGRPKESYKKGGRIKKSVKKTKARKPPAKTKSRKRAALRGHRAELRGG